MSLHEVSLSANATGYWNSFCRQKRVINVGSLKIPTQICLFYSLIQSCDPMWSPIGFLFIVKQNRRSSTLDSKRESSNRTERTKHRENNRLHVTMRDIRIVYIRSFEHHIS